jgi:hypothetical protein
MNSAILPNKRAAKVVDRHRDGPNPSQRTEPKMAQAESKTTTPYPKHIQIWEHPERAPKIEKLPGTWMGHCLVHITHALNETAPEERAMFIKNLQGFLRHDAQAVARRDRDRAKRSRSARA